MKTYFIRKPMYEELITGIEGLNIVKYLTGYDEKYGDGDEFEIEKVVTLGDAEFDSFIHYPLSDYSFIEKNTDLMFKDEKDIRHCILVKGKTTKIGILVDSEGYTYARYAACIKLSKLNQK